MMKMDYHIRLIFYWVCFAKTRVSNVDSKSKYVLLMFKELLEISKNSLLMKKELVFEVV